MAEELRLQETEEKKNRRISIIMTFVVALILFLFFLYPFFRYPDPKPEKAGIQIALGMLESANTDASSGSEVAEEPTSTESSSSSDASEPQQDASAEPSSSDSPQELEPRPSSDEKPSVNEVKEPKKDNKVEEKAKAEAAREAKAAKEKAEAEAKRKAEAAKQAALDAKKKALGDLFGDGEETDPGGDPNGDPDASEVEGMTTGFGEVEGLGGRSVLSKPRVRDNSQKTGVVVIKICVNADGKVYSAEYTQKNSTTNDAELIALATRKAREYRFSAGELDKQCGRITFKFELK